MKRPIWSVPETVRALVRGRRPGLGTAVTSAVLVGAVLASLVGLPAWARVLPGPPDVLVKALGLKLAFGSEPQPEPPPPPPAPETLPTPSPRNTPFEPITLPDHEPLDLGFVECDLTDVTFPERPLQPDVDGAALPGRYPWRIQGELTFLGITAQFDGINTSRTIGEVTPLQDGGFAYTYRSNAIFYREVQRIEVRPDDGMYLAELRRETQHGPFLTFRPLVPVKIVSLPIPLDAMLPSNSLVEGRLQGTVDDQTYGTYDESKRTERSAGVDPVNGRTVTIESAVRGSQRVNACGQLVDGYLVTGQRTITSPRTDPGDGEGDVPALEPPDPSLAGLIELFGATNLGRATVEDFELVIVPHLGALIVRERLDHVVPALEPNTGLPIEIHADFLISAVTPDDTSGSRGDG